MEKKYFIKTYGCQMNFCDSERLMALLEKEGFYAVNSLQDAKFIIVNTCSVRKHAEDRAINFLRSNINLKRKGKIFCLIGCTANLYGKELLERFDFIDVICGPNRYKELPEVLSNIKNGEKIVLTGEVENPFIDEIKNDVDVSSSISITKGCENFCSYCVVPYTRGKLISKPAKKIIEEVKKLVEKGVKEVILLGQNVNEYGKDTGENFVELIEKIHGIEGIVRIGFLTSHPKDVPEKLLYLFRDLPKLYKHFHLPLQSGSDRILKLMNRRYTVSHYLGIVEKVREIVPNISITSDIIVGFPGEKEEDFMETYKIVEKVKFDDLFVFKYSPRPKTKASKFPDDVPQKEKERRHSLILNLQDKISLDKNKAYEGKIENVFVRKSSYKRKGYLVGRTETEKPVLFQGEEDLKGKVLKVRIIEGFRHYLFGKLCENNK